MAGTAARERFTGHDEHRPPGSSYWHPVDEEKDLGAHGAFDGRSRASSLHLCVTTHRVLVARGLATAAAPACAAALLAMGTWPERRASWTTTARSSSSPAAAA